MGPVPGSRWTLEAADVTKTFQEGRAVVQVLKGMSLALRPGEIVSLEGPSGSGKTTLLSVLGCILTPTSGRVTVAGEFVDPSRPSRLVGIRRRFIGFAFQQYNLFPALSAVENVEYALNVKRITRNARAMAGHPPLLLADEPTANLDSHVGGQILDIFHTLARRNNQSLLIVTHDPEVRRIVDRVILIRDGRFIS
jgi:putative ABC transport system ATP-binding protein